MTLPPFREAVEFRIAVLTPSGHASGNEFFPSGCRVPWGWVYCVVFEESHWDRFRTNSTRAERSGFSQMGIHPKGVNGWVLGHQSD